MRSPYLTTIEMDIFRGSPNFGSQYNTWVDELWGGLAPLLEMYRPADVWPSDEIARKCYGRPWFHYEFTNADRWQTTDYVLVKVKFVS
jgi:hypothetical protein